MSALSTGDAVFAALVAKADGLRAALAAKVDANLAGGILQTRSGALRASIRSALDAGASSASVTLESTGVPYAAIQEYGGRTAAHEIVAVKGRALRFGAGGGVVFARRVHHPGSTIPAHAYLGSALDAMRAEILEGLRSAVLESLEAR